MFLRCVRTKRPSSIMSARIIAHAVIFPYAMFSPQSGILSAEIPLPLGAAGYSLAERGENPTTPNKVERTSRSSREYLTLHSTSRSFRAFSALMKTFSAKAKDIPRKWWVIDAKNQVLGQVAVKAANLLRGKEKTIFTPHVDTGDFVVIINADKVRLTGKKEEQKSHMS